MTRIVVMWPQAAQDVKELWLYIAEQSGPERADRVTNHIRQKFDMLIAHPQMGRKRDELRPGLRSIVIDRHIAFYMIEQEDRIGVVRILYGGRDIPPLFTEDE